MAAVILLTYERTHFSSGSLTIDNQPGGLELPLTLRWIDIDDGEITCVFTPVHVTELVATRSP